MKEFFNALTLLALLAIAWFTFEAFNPSNQISKNDEQVKPVVKSENTHTSTPVAATSDIPEKSNPESRHITYTEEDLLTQTSSESMIELKKAYSSEEDFVLENEKNTENGEDRIGQSIAILERLTKLSER